ncbi:MAG: mechanosensitive ion channel family protein [Phycisphaerales bacterium]|nr:mechanosensitive ion channel family protein [Phycisphaerae bacterium]NNF44021.1 mechanosensitive ion channel family protein [Phycisphaerales bacterium]NNM24670.1 mechanosensitive ion channel family protein [Phycisphaerales bacterium]
MTLSRRLAVALFALCIASLVIPATALGQATRSVLEEGFVDELLLEDVETLRIRLAPIPLERLEQIQTQTLTRLEEHAETLATAIVQQIRLRDAAADDAERLAAANAEVATLLTRKSELVVRANAIIAAVERKGGVVAAARAYVSAIEGLVPEEPAATTAATPAVDPATDGEARLTKRVSDLVAVVRAEAAAHERPVPWEVPLSEFELEMQPLPMDAILARLDKWREILEREIRKRVRIDILLNDGAKLEQTLAQLQATTAEAGGAFDNVDAATIKSRLAERSQEQQQIINAIVARMQVAILLVERRGGDAEPYARYIAAATGQKLNLTDLSVLRAQLVAWFRSPDGGVRIGLNVAKFFGIVFVFWIVSRLLGRLTHAAVRRVPKASSLLAPVLVVAVRRVTMLVGLVIGVSMLGVNIGPLLAMIGAAGLVIGLALQGTLSNFASGILILLNRPYDVGSVINAGGVAGKVEAMNLVSTSILTFDNQLMLVPNNQIWNGVITNVTGKPTRRVDLVFGIGYTDDMDRAVEIIREVITAHPKVHDDPAPTIRVNELGDNSVNVIARPWANTADYWEVYWDVMHRVKMRFDEEDINIPFPQRDVHLPGPIEVTLTRGSQSVEGVGAGA